MRAKGEPIEAYLLLAEMSAYRNLYEAYGRFGFATQAVFATTHAPRIKQLLNEMERLGCPALLRQRGKTLLPF